MKVSSGAKSSKFQNEQMLSAMLESRPSDAFFGA